MGIISSLNAMSDLSDALPSGWIDSCQSLAQALLPLASGFEVRQRFIDQSLFFGQKVCLFSTLEVLARFHLFAVCGQENSVICSQWRFLKLILAKCVHDSQCAFHVSVGVKRKCIGGDVGGARPSPGALATPTRNWRGPRTDRLGLSR